MCWGQFLLERGVVDEDEYSAQSARHHEDYQQGSLNMAAYVAYRASLVTHLDMTALRALRAEFFQSHLLPMLRPKAVKCIAAHRAKDALVILISATNSFLLEPLARHLQVELIGTDVKLHDGRLSAEIEGEPCFQAGKIVKLQAWLRARPKLKNLSMEQAWFYSDSHNDLPLLRAVRYPVVVNPDRRLQQAARASDWLEAEFALGD